MIDEAASVSGLEKVDYDPFGGPEIERVVNCTEPQLEVLTSCLLGGNDANLAFNESVTMKFTGSLDRAAMEHAFQKVILRHESLRSAFSIKNKQLCIFKNLAFELTCLDVSLREDVEKHQIVKDYIHQDSFYLFDLVNGPLIKGGLIKSNESEHYLVITVHHIICDGWSFGIILQDLGKLYSAYVQNRLIELPKPILFSKFAEAQNKFLQSKEYREIETFWVDQYSDNIPVLNLPTDFPRPQLRTYKSNQLDHKLDTNLVAAIKSMGIRAGCSLVTTLLASFEIFLSRITGQHDIVVGLPTSGQSATDNYHLVGHCVNLLPLRSNPLPGISFLEYVKKRKTATFDAYEHQRLTFGSLLKELKISRDPSRIPLVPVVFNIDMGVDDGVDFFGLSHQFSSNPKTHENFELFLNVSGTENSLSLEWSYNSQLFRAATIERMIACFEHLLKAIISNPTIKLGDIELTKENEIIAEPERLNHSDAKNQGTHSLHGSIDIGFVKPGTNTFLGKENGHTNAAYPIGKTIIDLFEDQAATNPANIALVFEEEQLTYKDLNERSNQLAHHLRGKGVKADTLVAICIGRSTEMLVGILGILKAGGAYVPIDPGYPADRISFMLKDIAAGIIVSSKEISKRLFADRNIQIIEMDSGWPLISKEPVVNLRINIQPNNLAYVIYTSGSTGNPKGVLVTHGNVVSLVRGVDYVNFTSRDILLSTGSSSFDATTFEYWGMLLNGGQLVLCKENKLLDSKLLKEEINTRGVNRMWFTAGWFNQLVETDITLFEKLETILVGGEKLPEHSIEKLRQTYPHIEIINGYGPTENTTFSLTYKITETRINKPIPIGRPLSNRSAFILDEHLQPVPEGVKGEIYLSGAGLSRGYLGRPELTAEKFINNPFSAEHGAMMYRSGDFGRLLPDGNIEFLGRMDDQVKIRGYRVELGEIENVIQQSKLVTSVLIQAKEDYFGNKRLIGFFVPANKSNKDAIVGYLSSKVPEYMVPAIWIELERFPLSSNGKIDRKALPEPDISSLIAHQYQAPRDEKEALLAEIWQELLGIGKVGIHDNFFELGGHSLIAIEVMTRIEKLTGKRIPPSTLFQYSTISKLVAVLYNKAEIIKWKSLVPIKPTGNKDPLYIIHGAGLDVMIFNNITRYMEKDQPVYGLKAIGIDGENESPEAIEEIAAFYISEVVQQNPSGPYALVGFSAGSLIAYEMAKQLKEMGKEIKMIGIIDYDLEQDPSNTLLIRKIERNTLQFFPRLFHVIKSLILHPKKTVIFQMSCIKLRYVTMLERLGLNNKTKLQGFYLHIENAMAKYARASINYLVTPLDVSIDLFSSKIKVYYVKDTKFLGWKPYALNGIKVHPVPGDHDEMLLTPNDKVFAHVLQQVLDNC